MEFGFGECDERYDDSYDENQVALALSGQRDPEMKMLLLEELRASHEDRRAGDSTGVIMKAGRIEITSDNRYYDSDVEFDSGSDDGFVVAFEPERGYREFIGIENGPPRADEPEETDSLGEPADPPVLEQFREIGVPVLGFASSYDLMSFAEKMNIPLIDTCIFKVRIPDDEYVLSIDEWVSGCHVSRYIIPFGSRASGVDVLDCDEFDDEDKINIVAETVATNPELSEFQLRSYLNKIDLTRLADGICFGGVRNERMFRLIIAMLRDKHGEDQLQHMIRSYYLNIDNTVIFEFADEETRHIIMNFESLWFYLHDSSVYDDGREYSETFFGILSFIREYLEYGRDLDVPFEQMTSCDNHCFRNWSDLCESFGDLCDEVNHRTVLSDATEESIPFFERTLNMTTPREMVEMLLSIADRVMFPMTVCCLVDSDSVAGEVRYPARLWGEICKYGLL